jgi:hypothetical protein
MILVKKWENRHVYKTGKGSMLVHRVGDLAVFESEDLNILRSLKIVHGFKESKEPIAQVKQAPIKMTKKAPSTEKQVKKVRRTRSKKSDK